MWPSFETPGPAVQALRTRATGLLRQRNWAHDPSGSAVPSIDGLAAASGLFFVAAGLSLIFGVTRIVNIAHGSLYMLGTYVAATIALRFEGALGFWGGIVLTAAADRALWRSHRDRAAAAHLSRAGAIPAARDLRAGAHHQRRGAVDLGPGGSAWSARAGPARRDRGSRPAAADATTCSSSSSGRWCC